MSLTVNYSLGSQKLFLADITAAMALTIESWQEPNGPVPPPRSEIKYIAPVAVG